MKTVGAMCSILSLITKATGDEVEEIKEMFLWVYKAVGPERGRSTIVSRLVTDSRYFKIVGFGL